MRSLRGRLGAGLVASLIVVFVVQWAVVTIAIREVAERYVLARIAHDMEALLVSLRPTDTRVTLDTTRLSPIYLQPFSGHYFRIKTADGTVIRSRSLWDQDLPPVDPPPGQQHVMETPGPQQQLLLVSSRTYLVRGSRVVISVGEDLAPLEQDLSSFNRRYALLSLIALAALLLLQGFIVRIGLRPLDRARHELRQLETGELAKLSEDVPTEVLPLVHELNRMLGAMNERLRRSREALGNLAHALKGPLTLASQLAEEEPVRHSPLRRQLLGYTDTIARLIDRELKRARLAGTSTSTVRRFDFARDVPPLVNALKALHREKALDIQTRIATNAVFAIDREDMLELLGNLLDNACKWARKTVRLKVHINGQLLLEVEDDGLGASAEELSVLAERGVRLDESMPGHGLGLGIVRDIVATYEGQLQFARSQDLGGLAVAVTLPATTG